MTQFVLTGCCATPGAGRPGTVTIWPQGAIAVRGERIIWAGPLGQLPMEFTTSDWAMEPVPGVIYPGFIDCHTHAIFAGQRASEFEERLAGTPYTEILARGGGILTTVEATRAAPLALLRVGLKARLDSMLWQGVTHVEVKSGYGLSMEHELRILEIIRAVAQESTVGITPTFLGAHAVPPEYEGRSGDYINLLINEVLPEVVQRQLAVFCDVYCEAGAFTPAEARSLLLAARGGGLLPQIHADQFSAGNGALVAGEVGAVNASHLEYTTAAGVRALAAAGTAAVLLPVAVMGTGMRDAPRPPVELFRSHGVPMALATDYNPGSSTCKNLTVAAALGCRLFGLTVGEALAGITLHAARALRLDRDLGCLAPGYRAHLTVLPVVDWREPFYELGGIWPAQVWINGVLVSGEFSVSA